MNIAERDKRLAFEEALVKKYFPDFKMYERRGIHFFSGWITTEVSKYKLRLVLDLQHPLTAQRMFIVSPRVLYKYGDETALIPWAFRTHSLQKVTSPGGRIQISYTGSWNAS
ncbi:MAG: hypothetical protein AMJ75_02535 [Phycisphaerae bacterium SM1_79]|nr:MAG: hypothetical protein AMJ75_02535 [Phycisphaerae bacterium SM1_79]